MGVFIQHWNFQEGARRAALGHARSSIELLGERMKAM